jgi:hypothetical protein
MIEMVVESIRVSLVNYQRVLILKEKETDRYLPIWIGPAEADAIAYELQKVSVARPLTHDLLKAIIGELGATVTSIIINDLANDTFFARIVMETGDRYLEVDSRPSDAIALAVRAKVPIYAAEKVLEKAGIFLEGDALKGREGKEMTEEEMQKLRPFRDFINSLDLDDLDKPKGS